ncbi:MAG: toprim domain-containing protein [Rhodobacteraceae bacterium]|nr:toprim domain-containing protein [Paracoccaceae bacterium]
MIASVSSGGIHRTFFDKRGNRLPKDSKMMLGPCSGGAVRLSESAGPLVVYEGIETGLSLVQLLTAKSPCVWAALSTGGTKTLDLPSTAGKLIIATELEKKQAMPWRSARRRWAGRYPL